MKARIRKTIARCMFSTFLGVNVPKKIGQILEESLPGVKLVIIKCFKIIQMNNKTHPTQPQSIIAN